METLAHSAAAPGAPAAARSTARTPAAAGPHWAWWLFLLGVLAVAFAGPSCAVG